MGIVSASSKHRVDMSTMLSLLLVTACAVACHANADTTADNGTAASHHHTRKLAATGKVLYQKTASGTYYYDVRNNKCAWQTKLFPSPAGGYFGENAGYPFCTSFNSALYQKMYQYKSNNIIAIDSSFLKTNRAKLCGKKVIVRYKGKEVAAPDGGDWFVWDGCPACIGGGIVDFSLSGLQKVNSSACFYGKVPGISYQVLDTQVQKFIP